MIEPFYRTHRSSPVMRIENDAVDYPEEDHGCAKAAKGEAQVLKKVEVVLGLSDGKHDQPSSEKSTRLTT